MVFITHQVGNLEGEGKPNTMTTDVQRATEMEDPKAHLSFYIPWPHSVDMSLARPGLSSKFIQ